MSNLLKQPLHNGELLRMVTAKQQLTEKQLTLHHHPHHHVAEMTGMILHERPAQSEI